MLVVVRDHVSIICEDVCDAVFGRHLLGALAVAATDGDHLHTGIGLEHGQM
jgi:hypothetical protein